MTSVSVTKALSAANGGRLEAGADILFAAAVERRLRTIHVAQSRAFALRHELVGAHGGRGVADARGEQLAGIGKPEKGDHVILIDAVAGDADRAHQLAAAINRHASRKDLNAVLEP